MDKVFTLLKILTEYTDEEHKLTTNQIIERFGKFGNSVHRNSIPGEIKKLEGAGYDIICEKGAENSYFLGSRGLEPAEVKMLCDALCSAQFVSKRKEKQLIKKLTAGLSKYQTKNVKGALSQSGVSKAADVSMYYFYEITTAIELNKKIKFKYTCYNEKKEKVYKHGGYVYTVSPYSTDWNDGRCYLSGFSERHDGVAVFRIDRIADLQITDEDNLPKPKNFEDESMLRQRFGMYGNGTATRVTLKCQNKHMNGVIDKFGENIETYPCDNDEDCFIAEADVGLSPTFFGWIFQYGGGISILSPQNAIDEYAAMAEKVLNLHKKLCGSEQDT